jgi:hypothetical protein
MSSESLLPMAYSSPLDELLDHHSVLGSTSDLFSLLDADDCSTISRTSTMVISTAAIVGSFLAVRYRQDLATKRNAGTYHVETGRSGRTKLP